MSQQQETLQNCIQMIQSNKQMSERKTIKIVSKIVKHFTQYTKDKDTLPPETLIPCCLFSIPTKFYQLMKIDQTQPLDQQPENKAVQLALETYLKALIRLLQKCDQQIKHVVIEGISKSILLTVPYPKISKKWLKQLINIWATQTLNINLGLRAFIAVNKFLKVINDETFMWALRRIYVAYFENSKQVSWRNLEHVNFMINCFCEITKINQSRTYYVLFGLIRSIALQMANLNKTKKKQKVQIINKLYSNQILNCFKLFTAVVSRVNSQQLTSLLYPLIQLTVAYEKITQASQFIPLKLHLLTNLLTIMQQTQIFIPSVISMIESLLKNKLFTKKLSKKAQKVGGDLELSFKLSPADLSNTNLINDIFQSAIHKVYWFSSIVQKLPGGSQILKKLSDILKHLQYSFSGYKTQISQTGKLLKDDYFDHYKLRASRHVSILEKKGTDLIQKILANQQFQMIKKFQQIRADRQQMLKKKLIAENEEEGEGQGEQQIVQDQDQVNSGWQEAEQGASSFHDQEQEKRNKDFDDSEQEQQQEQVSYEGDLDEEGAEQAIKQWEQQEWDSQGQF